MRIPVRLPIQVVHAGPGTRRTVPGTARRRYGLHAYGGDVRRRNPLSLVFHGGLGQPEGEWAPPLQQTYDAYSTVEPAPISVTYPDILSPTDQGGAYSPPYQPPPVAYADILPSIYSVVPSVATPPFVPPSDTSSSWWQDLARLLPAITGAGTAIASAATGGGAPVSYIIPATASTPQQRVFYNPATGQVTTAPTVPAGYFYNPATGQVTPSPSALPSFLQAAPGAAWYQNPLVLLGGGLAAVLFVVMAARR